MTQDSSWRKILQKFLLKLVELLGNRPRKVVRSKASIFAKEIHVPTPLVGSIIFAIFFFIFIYELGFYYTTITAIFLFLSSIFFLSIFFLKKYSPKIISCDDSVTMLGFILISFSLLIEIIKNSELLHPIVTPIPAAVMLVSILLGVLPAFIVLFILLMIMLIFYDYNFMIFFVMLFGSIAGIIATSNIKHRRDVSKATLYVGLAYLISILIIELFGDAKLGNIFPILVWLLINVILCGIITIGLLPYLESFFSITTNIHLLELADFTQPLLQKLMVYAPGTYQHSIVVGNLGEIAAREVSGANPLLVRVGAYYHDIGKIGKSEYFIENQNNIANAHDELKPNLSSLIIVSHVKDGVDVAKKYKLDRSVIDIIAEHHGTGLVSYFYHKAKTAEKKNDEIVDEQVYRYPGPKPKSKEAAIVMLADGVEAATRSLDDYSHLAIKEMVKKIINSRFVEGQLDECNITLTDLHKIRDSFIKTLTSTHHSRIEYPSTDRDKNEDNNK